MILQHQVAKRLQSAFYRSHLNQYIPAVAVVVQHFTNAIELANHAL